MEMNDRFMRWREVVKVTGRPRSSLQRDIQDGRFPPPVKIGPRAVGWRLSTVVNWMNEIDGASNDS